MLKKTRLYVAISLMVQAISFAFLFIALVAKKKSIAFAFLALSAMEGAGGYYLWKQETADKKDADDADILGEDFDLDESMLSSALNRSDDAEEDDEVKSVEKDTDASEDEFKH